ncbi:MAG: hypothetical protein ACREPM_22925 [Gemmatimonadaceae bacterium]
MSHLPTERLAALVDEAPTPAELAHLAICAACARERAAYRSLADLASAESARLGAPLTDWESLAPALRRDGVIDDGRGPGVRVKRARRPWLEAAAAVLLVAGGVVGGRLSASASPFPTSRQAANRAANVTNADSMPGFRTVQDARAAQAQAQAQYQTATAYLAQQDTTGRAVESPSAMRARLAALQRAQDAMGEALTQAPYDPVINGYYLTTLGQRAATMQRLNTVVPVSMRMTSY